MPEARRRACHPAAGNIDVAGDGLQNRKGAAVLGAIGGLILGAGALEDTGPFGAGKKTRQPADIIGGNPGQRFCPFRCKGLHMGDQFVKAGGLGFDEITVIEIFGNDDVHHGQGQGAVGAGADAQIHVGFVGQGDALGIDDHQLSPFFQVFLHEKFKRKIGLVGVVAPENIEVGVRFFGGIAPKGQLARANAHAVTDTFHRKKIWRPVTRAQQMDQG